MLTCFDVAGFFIARAEADDAGEQLSNLKIQKLAYYAQGLYLALNDAPLFNEPVEAWVHGPVVPPLYHRLKRYGSGAVTEDLGLNKDALSEEVIDFLLEVYQVYGQFSAVKLRQMTHDEEPWKNTPLNCVITLASMKDFFKTRLV